MGTCPRAPGLPDPFSLCFLLQIYRRGCLGTWQPDPISCEEEQGPASVCTEGLQWGGSCHSAQGQWVLALRRQPEYSHLDQGPQGGRELCPPLSLRLFWPLHARLKFLHPSPLRFHSSKSGKIYLHDNIRLLFSRKSIEVDSGIPYELKSFTEMPRNPRYSPWP